MAYNKVLQSTLPDLKNFEDDNSIIKNNNSLNFIDKLNISKKIDDVSNSIDQIVFDGSNIIVSGNLKFLNSSNFSSIKSLGDSSVLKFLDLDVGLKLNTDEDLEFYNNISDGDIHVSSSVSVPNNKTIFINKASGSITHIDESENTLLISKAEGGISVSTPFSDLQVDPQNPSLKYLEMSFSNSSNTTVSSPPFNVSYLSNDRSKCKISYLDYNDDPDILQLKGNYYYHADYTNPGGNVANLLLNIFGSYWTDNVKNGITLHSNSYQIVPQCTILRPLNSSSPTQENINHYFSGDTHYIKFKNNDEIVEAIGTKTVNMFLLDLTSSSFTSNLKAGFKIDVMIDEYNERIFDIISANSTFPIGNTSRNNALTNYLPNREITDINGNYNVSKFYPIGFEKVLIPASQGQAKQLTGGYFPCIGSRQRQDSSNNSITMLPSNALEIQKNGYNYVYPTDGITYYKTPANPLNGDYFYFEITGATAGLGLCELIVLDRNNLTTSGVLFSLGSNPVGKLIMSTASNKNTYTMNNLQTGINTVIFKFVYSSSKSEWEYTGTNLGSQEDFEEQYIADFGLLQKPSTFCVELPIGHTIINLDTDVVKNKDIFYKNTVSFYLYGNREAVYPGVDGFIQGTHRRIKGGWLKINDENNLPFNQVTPVKTGFKKRYDNLFLLNPKKTDLTNTGFAWPQSSNFQFTYLGNNQWFMS